MFCNEPDCANWGDETCPDCECNVVAGRGHSTEFEPDIMPKPKQNKNKAQHAKKQHKPKQRKGGQGPRRSRPVQAVSGAMVAVSDVMVSQKPSVSRRGDATILEHTEMIGEILGTTTFTVAYTLNVNPGNPQLNPWAAVESAGFQEWELESLEVFCVTRASTSDKGNIMIGMDYDASSVAPTSELELSNSIGTVQFAPWQNGKFSVDKASLKALSARKYILKGYAVNDIKTYCPGVLYICTNDAPAGSEKWAKLWVRYRYRVHTAEFPVLSSGNLFSAGKISGGGSMSSTDCLGTAPVVDAQAVGVSVVYSDTAARYEVQLPGPWEWMVYVDLVGTTITTMSVLSAHVTGSDLHDLYLASGLQGEQVFKLISVSGPDATWGRFYIQSAGAGTITACTLRIAQVPAGSMDISIKAPIPKLLKCSEDLLREYMEARVRERIDAEGDLANVSETVRRGYAALKEQGGSSCKAYVEAVANGHVKQ